MNYFCKVQNGQCKLYDAQTRNYKGYVGSKVVSAVVQGDQVAVTCENGQVQLYNCKTRAYKGHV